MSEALADRFTGLPETAVEVLSLAAVVGQPFSAGLLAEVAGRPVTETAAALAEAAAARLLTAADRTGGAAAPGAGVGLGPAAAPGAAVALEVEPFRFAHDLFREHAYHRLAAQDRARLHGQAGAALAARRAAGPTCRWPSWPGTSARPTRTARTRSGTVPRRPGKPPGSSLTRKRSGTGKPR